MFDEKIGLSSFYTNLDPFVYFSGAGALAIFDQHSTSASLVYTYSEGYISNLCNHALEVLLSKREVFIAATAVDHPYHLRSHSIFVYGNQLQIGWVRNCSDKHCGL